MNTDTYVTVRRPVGVDSTSTSTSSTVSQPSGSGFFKRSLNANANSRQTCSSPYIVTVILLLLILTWIGASIDFWSHHHQQQQQGEGLNFNSEAIGIEQVTSPSPPPTLTQTINTNQKQSQQIITTPSVPCPTSTSVVSSASPATSICRPGTQRCITGSTATSYSRFNLLATSKSENHGRLSSTNHARSQAPYDVDGTPKFRERLEAYTVEHRRATDVAGMIAEIRQDTGIMTGKSEILVKAFEKRIGRERYTVFIDGPSGLGNKLLPLVSTFGYSLLTNRTLLWHLFPSALEELLHFGPTADLTPEQKSSGMEASSILEGSMTKFMSDLITAYREIDPAYTSSNTDPRQPPSSNGGAHWTDKVAIALFHSPLPPVEDSAYPSWKSFPAFVAHFPRAFQFTSYDMRSPDSGRVKASFVCQDVIMRDTASWLVYTTSDQYWLPTMAGNSFTRPTLVSWVNEGNMYGPLARWLLNWNSNAIRQVANDFARRHFGSYTIGLQFRLRERMQLTTSEIRIAVQAAIQLAATYQGAYDPEFDGPPNLNPTKYFGLELVPNDVRRQQLAVDPTGTRQLGATHYRGYVPGQNDFPENGPRPFVTFFIATDDLNVRQRLKTMLEPYGQVALPPSDSNSRDESGSGLRGAYYVKKDNVGALKWAIIENLLLSSCDDILVSPTSTYGYSAYGYGSLVPHRILLDPTGYVLRHLTSEPMAHFWKPLFREVTQMELCRVENDLPSFGQGDECCPRWGSGARIPPDGI